MDALRCPPPDADVTVLSGGERRRVALCKLLLESPTCCCSTSPPTTSTPSACCGSSSTSPSTPAPSGRDPRPVLPRQRRRVDPRGRPRAPVPLRGQLLHVPGEEAGAAEVQGKKDAKLAKRLKDELEWVRSNAKGRQAKSKARLARYEEMAAEAERTRKLDFEEIQIPPGPRLGNVVIEADGPAQGLRRPGAHRRPVLHAAAQRHRRRHRPQRRRQDHAVQDDRRAGAARRRRPQDRRDGEDLLRRPVPRRHRPQEDALGGRLRRAGLHQGRQRRDALARLRLGVRLQGPGPAEAGRGALRRGAQPPQPRADAEAGRQPAAARRAHQRPRRRDPRLAGERAAGVPRLRRRRQPRPVVPRPGRHAHPRLGGHDENPRSGTGSRATSSPTRRTRSSGWAPRRHARTG